VTPARSIEVSCEFCGALTRLVSSPDLTDNRVACESCRARVKWCPACGGVGCDVCQLEGTAPGPCQRIGYAFCEPGCRECDRRLAALRDDQTEQRMDEARLGRGAL